jgi:uncharacterized protein (DUF934 family)
MNMSEIIKDGKVVSDDWTVLRLAEDQQAETVVVPDSAVIVPLPVWLAQHETLSRRANVGVWLASSERAEALKNDIAALPLIAVDFPKFSDGRGYSIAFNLRSRSGFQGELRAIGDVLRDQLFYMQRVGFNAFATRPDRNIHDALKGLTDFSLSYQASIDEKAPLFRRVDRSASHAA